MRFKLALLAVVCLPLASPQAGSLPPSEALSYRIEWRLITAGRANLEWTTQPGRPEHQAKLHLESVGLVSTLYRVQDDYLAEMDRSLCTGAVQSTTREGSRQREARITFDSGARKASYLERDRVKNTVIASLETDIPPCTHDVIGGIYYLRTLNLEPGQSAQIPVSDGKKSVMAKVEAQEREDVKVPDGTYKTIRYEVFLFNNVLYRRSARLYVWLSDDRRKLPVQIQVKLQFTVGTITLELEKHE
ncbi:MAG: DUF3108 domain-containing protein [Bryobacteraceae bacterium]|jgi:hypothetical protein